ncbi:PorP/SprF family type IX secretion system membrane protein [Deminuibacter soli]|uniref:Type IX secretion system membrane protein PorP/SprF n=1 Tax=Deminuibacter soli TaxID=2291815 RepID=A0A3E1NE81_9BACT|nr:type IX secretion system membrane protein PorP/SprF [Deminuibacter soli]RFM26283.1 type IX secretion system membrane protein PorP/SprF [Deminuibacter soli]
MKKWAITLTGSLLCSCLLAQQKPQYTQYVLNQYIINPALTGIENYTDLRVSHRRQWNGLNGAPVTTYFTVHGALNKKDYRTTATSFEMPGENPRGSAYWENYTAAEPHHGIGMQVINDKAGPIKTFTARATYAYHLGISPSTSIAAGMGIGVENTSLDAASINFGDLVADPAVNGKGYINAWHPDISAGVYLYAADYFIGLSAQQIVPQKISYSGNKATVIKDALVPHLFATAGYRFLLSDDINCTPSVMLKYVQPLPVQFEANIKLQYRSAAWVGASIRQRTGFAAMLGVNLSNTVNLGYSYDYTTSLLGTVSNGTHELMLGFLLGNRYDDGCPKNVW